MDFLRSVFSIIFDSHFYKKKASSGKKITWVDIIFSPVIKIAALLGLLFGLIKLILFLTLS